MHRSLFWVMSRCYRIAKFEWLREDGDRAEDEGRKEQKRCRKHFEVDEIVLDVLWAKGRAAQVRGEM